MTPATSRPPELSFFWPLCSVLLLPTPANTTLHTCPGASSLLTHPVHTLPHPTTHSLTIRLFLYFCCVLIYHPWFNTHQHFGGKFHNLSPDSGPCSGSFLPLSHLRLGPLVRPGCSVCILVLRVSGASACSGPRRPLCPDVPPLPHIWVNLPLDSRQPPPTSLVPTQRCACPLSHTLWPRTVAAQLLI